MTRAEADANNDIAREMIGGPMHGESMIVRTKWLIIPVIKNYNFPKQERKTGSFGQVVYERIDINGKHFLKYVSGYY